MKALEGHLETNGNAIAHSCAHCSTGVKSRKRDFSEKAWHALIFWNEVQRAAIDRPICDDCYAELREVLIDRSDEIETTLQAAVTLKARKSVRKGTRAASRLAAG